MSQQKSSSEQQHPMLPVPDAIRTVLYETARILQSTPEVLTEEIPVTAESTTILSPDNPLVGRTLAEDVIQREPGYPPYRASIMDGYAISTKSTGTKATTTATEQQWTHTVVDKVYAGDAPSSNTTATSTTTFSLPPAHYVTTGAIVPDTYDCVVPVEQCVVDHANNLLSIQPDANITPNTWIRQPACDIAPGSVVVPAGHVLNGVSLALLLQAGVTRVAVKKQVTVGVLSTGNELEQQQQEEEEVNKGDDAWEARKHGKIPDANRPILLHLLSSWGYCKVVDLGIVRDTSKEDLASCLREAALKCHVVVTTGGISMGESDIVEEVLLQHLGGRLHFGRLHMKPGKPTTVMTLPSRHPEQRSDRMIFCLPGNPVSATVCAQLLLRPCLHLWFHGPSDLTHGSNGGTIEEQLQQTVESAWVPLELQATLANDVKLDKERPEYLRVTLEYHPVDAGPQYSATSTGVQRSSRLMSMRDAQGLMVLPQGTVTKPVAQKGETYTVLWLGNSEEASIWLPSVQVRTSRHLAKQTSVAFSVGLVLLTPKMDGKYDQSLEDLSQRIGVALSGSKSGSVATTSAQVYDGAIDDGFYNHLSDLHVDFCILVTTPVSSSFYYHTQVSNFLRSKLTKVADSMALQVRKGAAKVAPQAAMYETVVGYLPSSSPNDSSVVVLLSELGLDGALGNVRGLVKHALQIARGTCVRH